jgi:hypothetical protein
MKSALARRIGLPALFLSGAIIGSAITGVAFANQPHMVNALHDLQTAQSQLNAATADKGGHRDNALSLVSQAISQVRAGIAYAAP